MYKLYYFQYLYFSDPRAKSSITLNYYQVSFLTKIKLPNILRVNFTIIILFSVSKEIYIYHNIFPQTCWLALQTMFRHCNDRRFQHCFVFDYTYITIILSIFQTYSSNKKLFQTTGGSCTICNTVLLALNKKTKTLKL